MKDVAYFVGSCLDEGSAESREEELLDCYLGALRSALVGLRPEVDGAAVCAEWRGLYRLAWTDFHRFIKGWSPGHWKITGYSERVAQEVIAELGN